MTGPARLLGRLGRLALVSGVALAAAVVLPGSPAGALPILESADATELAQTLAEATEDQDVCYGWEVQVSDAGGSASGTDAGSSLGVGRTPIETQCERYVVFKAYIRYTSSASESEDSASFDVRSNVAGAPTAGDLAGAGISGGGLLGNNDDQTVANAVLLLPALMAEKGLAEPITLEGNTEALPSGDRATGTPGSDWLRKNGALLGFAAVTFAGGLGWVGWIMLRERPFGAARKPSRRRTGGLP